MIRDLAGNPIPYGKTKRIIEENFLLGTTLPTWLTVTGNGDFQVVPPNQNFGYLKVNTGAVVDDTVFLNIYPTGIHMKYVKEMVLELDSFAIAGKYNDYSLFFDFLSSDGKNGFQFFSILNNSRAKLNGVNTLKTVLYAIEADRRVNLKFIIRNDRTVILMENDSVVFEHRFTESEMNITQVIYPKISLKNLDGTIRSLQFSRIALSIVHN